MRIEAADGSIRTLAFTTSTGDVAVVDDATIGADATFANARERLAHNRAGRGGTALDFPQLLAFVAGEGRPAGFAVADRDAAAYEDWRIRAWPDDLRVTSIVAAADPWANARLGTAVAVVRDGALLLGRRIASYGNGAWQTPGGKPDGDERLAVAAARELEEETGLRATAMRYATSQVDTMPETGVTWRTHFWLARVAGDVENREPDKCSGWAWFPLTALPAPLFAIDPRTIATIVRLADAGSA